MILMAMPPKQAKVVLERITESVTDATAGLLDGLGGLASLLRGAETVWIKPNGIGYDPGHFTDPAFLEALFILLRDAGIRRIVLFENCTNGSFTRLVYHVTGYTRLCRRYGVEPMFLDEQKTVPVTLGEEENPVAFPEPLFNALIRERDGNFYINAPKLKTHPMTKVTLGVKNQQGLLRDQDKMHNHHFGLHERLVDIFRFIRPDATIVEGLDAVQYGHFPARAHLKGALVPLKILVGGTDTIAVDTATAWAVGYDPGQVEHLRLAAEAGLGCGDLEAIELVGDTAGLPVHLPCEIIRDFPSGVRFILGTEMACIEGCRGNTEVFVEYIHADFGAEGRINILCGKGIDRKELENLDGDFLIVGPCGVSENLNWVREHYPDRRILHVNEHNDLRGMVTAVKKLFRISTFKMAPVNPLTAVRLLLAAKLHGLNSRIPPLLG